MFEAAKKEEARSDTDKNFQSTFSRIQEMSKCKAHHVWQCRWRGVKFVKDPKDTETENAAVEHV